MCQVSEVSGQSNVVLVAAAARAVATSRWVHKNKIQPRHLNMANRMERPGKENDRTEIK